MVEKVGQIDFESICPLLLKSRTMSSNLEEELDILRTEFENSQTVIENNKLMLLKLTRTIKKLMSIINDASQNKYKAMEEEVREVVIYLEQER